MKRAELHWITGPSGSGKTTRLMHIYDQLRQKNPGLHIGGFLAMARYGSDGPEDYTLYCLHKPEKILLASRTNRFEKSVPVGRFFLNAAAMESCIRELIDLLPDLDVLFVDEAGPLELRGGGWDRLLQKAVTIPGLQIYLAVRDKLKDKMKVKYNA
ncbi:MAG: hypothetical protein GXO24_04600 [Chlorobi bacterium]|nr:hypothetical protein [Chlorobiota bacterium]